MKILFCPCHYVFDDGDRGSEISWAYQIAQRIAKKHIKSLIVTGFKNLKNNVPFSVVAVQPWKNDVDLSLSNSLQFNFLYSKYALTALRKNKYDILHHVLPFGIDRTFNLSFFFSNVPKVVGPIQNQLPIYTDNIHDVTAHKKGLHIILLEKTITFLTHPVLKYLSTQTLNKADKIIVINERTKQILLERNIVENKIIIIPPGIDCKKFSVSSSRAKKKIEILAVGALMRRKGFDVLFKAVAEVIKKNENFTLRIVGDGPQRKELESLAKELGIAHILRFEGHVPHFEMGKYYREADIFVNMSRAEGFATVCLEAMASGLAIVSSKVGGFQDALEDGINGYLVEQEDYKMLAKRVLSLLHNPKKLKKIRAQARKDVEAYYDWDTAVIPEYLAIYKSLQQ